ncbi:sperm microtubule associated protein 2 [Amia ocellicauda]|uniref:sperm microtubule associated protein 2 n=1 Tax=Amia ocellicauda TaxID=2972642 RepID=UPI0034647F13
MAVRIEQLSRPKPNLLKYPDRRSVYWLDELPPATGRPTSFTLSPWLAQLCHHRGVSHCFQEHRSSPVWTVSAAALTASPSDRLCALAQPRPPSQDWTPDRPLLATVSLAVRSAVPSARLCQLARPKRLAALPPRDHQDPLTFDPKLSLAASPRIELLATPKSEHRDFLQDRPVQWPVGGSALEGVPSERVLVLARPRARGKAGAHDPYRVSEAALRACASPRTAELSTPLPRKQRQKKA